MFSQHQNLVSDASLRSQPRSGILTPASDNSLNSDAPSYVGLDARKRKRDDNTMDDLLKDSFTVRPYPATVNVKSRTLQPLLLLPRSDLPLSAIDIVSSAKTLPQSRLFEAHVKVLELDERMGNQLHILIARVENTHTLLAVERESRGLYVLFQLGSWINLKQLRVSAVASRQDVTKTSKVPAVEDQKPTVTPEANQYSKKKRLAIELIQEMVKRPTTSFSTDSPAQEADAQAPPSELAKAESFSLPTIVVPAPVEEVLSQPTATEIFEMASLAYFAKGPLSRARAAFHLDLDSILDMNDYIAFLESLVISTTLIEKKYRDGIPMCISLIDINDHSGDEALANKAKKRKSTKKVKIGKNGLYLAEDALIRRWWRSHDDEAESGAPGSSKEELTKARISHLRIRETQLQMIIILEVLALQPLASLPEAGNPGLPLTLTSVEVSDAKGRSTKTKKSDNLSTLIDVHVDRLCIWQSLVSESSNAPDVNLIPLGHDLQMKHTDNIPRDFCVDVIAPFFSARLPDRCATINRKLGGPVAVPQSKPKLSKSTSFSNAPSRPGAATKRPIPVKPREARTLKRVLSDDRERRSMSSGPNKKIALMRSATMPSGMMMKREASEAPSLSSIPIADSQSFTANRGGVLNSKRFSQREVDMSNMMPDIVAKTNPKEKQKAVVEAELRDAISALKRPNRELAGKSFAETIEKRSSGVSHSRKSKKPIRNPFFQSVQITATPKAVRRKDMGFEAIPSSARQIDSAESSFVPASSLPSIPQSVHRVSQDELPGRTSMFLSVQATPTRKHSVVRANDEGFGGLPPSSPIHIRRSSAQLFSGVPDSAVKTSEGRHTHGIQETPIKRSAGNGFDHSHPAVPSFDHSNSNREEERASSPITQMFERTKPKEDSIYACLGWDDDNDIDDLA